MVQTAENPAARVKLCGVFLSAGSAYWGSCGEAHPNLIESKLTFQDLAVDDRQGSGRRAGERRPGRGSGGFYCRLCSEDRERGANARHVCRFQKSSALAPAEFRGSADEYGHGDVTSPLHGIAFRSIVLCTNRHFSEVACTKQQRLLRRRPRRACCRDPPVERRDGDAEARGHFPGRCSLVE